MTDATDRRTAPAPGARRLADVIGDAQREFESLTGRTVESVSSVRRNEGGWTLALEVVELERVPASTSILGTYEAFVDEDGSVMEYERIRRYHRNQASEVDV